MLGKIMNYLIMAISKHTMVMFLLVVSIIILLCFFAEDLADDKGDNTIILASESSWSKLRKSYNACSLEELLNIKEDEIDIATAALIIAKGYDPKVNVSNYLKKIDDLAESILDKIPKHPDLDEVIEIINSNLFKVFKSVPGNLEADTVNGFLSTVLESNRGNCLGLSTLYVAIGRRLGLEMHMALIPSNLILSNHIFVTISTPEGVLNIETTDKGTVYNDSVYYDKYCNGNSDLRFISIVGSKKELSILLYNRGCAWSRKGRYDKEMEDYTKAIELDPSNFLAYANRGILWTKKGETEKALTDFAKAIVSNPGNSSVHVSRALIWFHNGKLDNAISELSKAIQINPDVSLLYYMRALVLICKGEREGAIEDLTKAIEHDPRNILAYSFRASQFLKKREYSKAISDYSKAIEFDPDDYELYCSRGTCRLLLGRIDVALDDFNKAIELNPKNAHAYNSRGSFWFKIKELDKAKNDFTSAIKLDPKDAAAYKNRAATFFLLNKYESAWKDIEKAEKLGAHVDSELKELIKQELDKKGIHEKELTK